VLISHKHRFIFFACGKTGTTSIEAALAKYDEGDSIRRELADDLHSSGKILKPNAKLSRGIKHIRPCLLRRLFPGDLWSEYYKFAFVRNPWDWMVSQYFFNFKAGYLKRIGVVKLSPRDLDRVRNKLKSLTTIGYESWVYDGGFQHSYVLDADGKPAVDYVGRFEHLNDDFSTICENIGIEPAELPALNSSQHGGYRRHYNAASRDAVYRAYWKDIEALGYEY
jgi:hypothetical protein